MKETQMTPNLQPLVERNVPSLSQEQLNLFQYEKMHITENGSFNPRQALERLRSVAGMHVYAIDLGGDKIAGQEFVVTPDGGVEPLQSQELEIKAKNEGSHGAHYVEPLTEIAKYCNDKQISVGISYGAPMKGTKPLQNKKFTPLINYLQAKHDGDFKHLFPTLGGSLNDGPAGLITGSIEANKRFGTDEAVYIINGGGFGLAVLVDGKMYATETGHVELASQLNSFNVKGDCGVLGSFVCLELAGSNGIGVEGIWERETGQKLGAKEIEDHWREGGEHSDFVEDLYDYSALVIAHGTVGAAKVLNLNLSDSSKVAVIGSGGAFKFPNYPQRVEQIIEQHTGSHLNMLSTYEFSPNACLSGAAIAGAIKLS
jgi:predicted NBD/HSP70 family sugar kinase